MSWVGTVWYPVMQQSKHLILFRRVKAMSGRVLTPNTTYYSRFSDTAECSSIRIQSQEKWLNQGITETHRKLICDPVMPYHFVVISDCSNSTNLGVSNILSTHVALFCQIWRSLEYNQLQLKSELDAGHATCYVNPSPLKQNSCPRPLRQNGSNQWLSLM